MYVINWSLLFLITLITFFIFGIFYLRIKRSNRKLIFIFITISVYMYSGVGISFDQVNIKHVITYITFLFFLLFSMFWSFKLFDKKLQNKLLNGKNSLDYNLIRFKKLYFILSVIFIFTIFINLLLPSFRISDLWNPPLPSLVNVFEKTETRSSSFILSISELIGFVLMPFFFIHLYILIVNKRKYIAFIWVLIWLYLDYLTIGYWGRYEMVVYIVFTILLFTSIGKHGFKVTKGKLSIIGIILLFLVQFFQNYRAMRLGSNITNDKYLDSLVTLVQSETYYPIYYSLITNFTEALTPLSYLLWLIFLPIPSIIWGSKPTISINDIFSYQVLGVQRGEEGFNVILPSILGESILVWGMHFFWIHAIIIGFLVGLFCVFYEKSKVLSVINLYFIVLILVIGRGGSQSYISDLINATIPLIIWIILITSSKQKIQKVSKD
ncbi:O-antigen polymerase [Halobacillus sp. K22]|uniref:O-antigen polymerase n=1 Tax=Halobacillus sp. K22 TaxID=3457431 RepID=UPI003FCC528C